MSRLTLELEIDLPLTDAQIRALEAEPPRLQQAAALMLAQRILQNTGAVVQSAQVCAT